jgi:hypothetical protein
MCRAAELGVLLGVTPGELPGRIARLVRAFGLPDAIDCDMAHYSAAVGLIKRGRAATLP